MLDFHLGIIGTATSNGAPAVTASLTPSSRPARRVFRPLDLRAQLLLSVVILAVIALIAGSVAVWQARNAERNFRHIIEMQRTFARALVLDAEVNHIVALSESVFQNWGRVAEQQQAMDAIENERIKIAGYKEDLDSRFHNFLTQITLLMEQAIYMKRDIAGFQQMRNKGEALSETTQRVFDRAISVVDGWPERGYRIVEKLQRLKASLSALMYIRSQFGEENYRYLETIAKDIIAKNNPYPNLEQREDFRNFVRQFIRDEKEWQTKSSNVNNEMRALSALSTDGASGHLDILQRRQLEQILATLLKLYNDGDASGGGATTRSFAGYFEQRVSVLTKLKIRILTQQQIAATLSAILDSERTRGRQEVDRAVRDASRSNARAGSISGVALILSVLAVMSLVWVIDRKVLRRLTTVEQGMLRLASGETIEIEEPDRDDEFGKLLRALKIFQNAELQRRSFEQKLHEVNRSLRLAIEGNIAVAARIQSRLFRTHLSQGDLFSDQCLLHEPRDAIGGDFCWAERFDDGYVIALVDCTGHGVPGAMMTIVLALLMKDVLQDEGHSEPAATLTRLAVRFKAALAERSASAGYDLDTGFDAAICFVDTRREVLRYVGGGIPLIVLRPHPLDPELLDGNGLGPDGSIASLDRVHTLEVPLTPGLRFYLASDGLASQPSGDNHTAYGWRRLLDTIKGGRDFPLSEQAEAVWRSFREFRGSCPQRDDVTLLGIRI
jgi:serine phosphatase RsbU (regulator of sigma subunit)